IKRCLCLTGEFSPGKSGQGGSMSAAHISPNTCTAFASGRRIASGPLDQVIAAVKRALRERDAGELAIFDDATGRIVEADLGAGFPAAMPSAPDDPLPGNPPGQNAGEPRKRGRPKLGVVAREVTLLPRHWAWLATQPGGSSVALRKLVDQARHTLAE